MTSASVQRNRRGSVRLRRSFAWNLGGNTVYNATQWLLVVLLARLGSAEMVGEFALAQAIAAPVYLTVGLNLRVIRATDVVGRFSPAQYFRLRLVLNAVSFAVSLSIAAALGWKLAFLAVLAAVAFGKASESTSQVMYGYFQLHDRLDLVSRSLLLRSVVGASGFLFGLVATGSLAFACLGMAVGWLLVFACHDKPAERRVHAVVGDAGPAAAAGTTWELVRRAAPLGVDGGVNSLTNNVPRFAIQMALGTGALGAFAALAYLARVVGMVTGSLAESVIGRLARQVAAGNAAAFWRLLRVLVMVGGLISLTGVLGAWLLGEPVIRLILGAGYVDQPVLLWLMAGAGVTALQRSLARGLQAGHRFSHVMTVDFVALLGTCAAAAVLVPRFGAVGAAATLFCGFTLGSVVAAILLGRMMRSLRGGSRGAHARR